ncbi:hypothetical protein [Loigolactobacillus bifermentans]|uniref:Uncharacterized protein n=1 Tax=Loigolactobacillus bifermentans DSM 20003 TaxID=1423726 RepID=A0A0R1H7W3_9LACO|nr:hypothetical protein [Loigolactobacillus bifermentans]KRK39969.1 hypothetical protein FC07_GL001766 [Loigolactobacillus bifermentans DSM 20003]QGG59665.1 hypothetical protein LB003_03745 [Loigolactobacillus bifermentans]
MIETKQNIFEEVLNGYYHASELLGEATDTPALTPRDKRDYLKRYTAAIIKMPLTANQNRFLRYLINILEDHNQSILSTLVWCGNHVNVMPVDVKLAYRALSDAEKNQVIYELALPF